MKVDILSLIKCYRINEKYNVLDQFFWSVKREDNLREINFYKVFSSYSFNYFIFICLNEEIGSGALTGKILLVKIVENNKIDAYFREG